MRIPSASSFIRHGAAAGFVGGGVIGGGLLLDGGGVVLGGGLDVVGGGLLVGTPVGVGTGVGRGFGGLWSTGADADEGGLYVDTGASVGPAVELCRGPSFDGGTVMECATVDGGKAVSRVLVGVRTGRSSDGGGLDGASAMTIVGGSEFGWLCTAGCWNVNATAPAPAKVDNAVPAAAGCARAWE